MSDRSRAEERGDARPLPGWVDLDLDAIPAVPLGVLAAVVLVRLTMAEVTLLTVFAHPPHEQPVFGPIWITTDGYVSAQTLVHLVMLAVVVAVPLWFVRELKPRHLGLDRRALPVGVAGILSLWVGLQLVGAAVAGLSGSITFSRSWQALGVAGWTKALVPELLGSALGEEVYYRGLLLAQGYLVAKRFANDRRVALVASLVVVQAWFAAVHIPARLVQGTPLPLPADILGVFLLGVVFALVYLRTGNLFLAVGVHALTNDPAPLFVDPPLARAIVLGLTVLLLVVWPHFRRRLERRSEGTPAA
jgi:hypothetical protein